MEVPGPRSPRNQGYAEERGCRSGGDEAVRRGSRKERGATNNNNCTLANTRDETIILNKLEVASSIEHDNTGIKGGTNGLTNSNLENKD